MTDFTTVARALHRAQAAHRAAKAALKAYREAHGGCVREPNDNACYKRGVFRYFEDVRLPIAEWCEACRGSQPLWEAYRKAARARGVAQKAFTRAGMEAE